MIESFSNIFCCCLFRSFCTRKHCSTEKIFRVFGLSLWHKRKRFSRKKEAKRWIYDHVVFVVSIVIERFLYLMCIGQLQTTFQLHKTFGKQLFRCRWMSFVSVIVSFRVFSLLEKSRCLWTKKLSDIAITMQWTILIIGIKWR